MKRGRRRERAGGQVAFVTRWILAIGSYGLCVSWGEKWVLDPSGVGEAGKMTESWKERPRDWLVQSLNDRKQGTSGCWEWVRERFVFLIVLCFLISSNMGTVCVCVWRGVLQIVIARLPEQLGSLSLI